MNLTAMAIGAAALSAGIRSCSGEAIKIAVTNGRFVEEFLQERDAIDRPGADDVVRIDDAGRRSRLFPDGSSPQVIDGRRKLGNHVVERVKHRAGVAEARIDDVVG